MFNKKIKRGIALAMSLCLLTNIPASAETSSGGSSDGSGDSSSSTTAFDDYVYYNQVGFKVTTYVMATSSLNYLMTLAPDLKSYIVHSRPSF